MRDSSEHQSAWWCGKRLGVATGRMIQRWERGAVGWDWIVLKDQHPSLMDSRVGRLVPSV